MQKPGLGQVQPKRQELEASKAQGTHTPPTPGSAGGCRTSPRTPCPLRTAELPLMVPNTIHPQPNCNVQ